MVVNLPFSPVLIIIRYECDEYVRLSNQLIFDVLPNINWQGSFLDETCTFLFLDSSSTLPFLNFSFPFLRVEERNSRRKEESMKRRRTKWIQSELKDILQFILINLIFTDFHYNVLN
ncbi:hypothetical protein BpHYR1_053208 [Brachionus plicatilis]|uniref:Uncharacterized protein n=1 Tax=Brachionus plicatilis TaxID=10195 RepID=A0A3M7PVP1_BRAPC|nr:hypothetical protein BpHYR1_053208 [Brachionus plicatilis]